MIDPDDKKQFSDIMKGLSEDKGIQLSAPGIALKFEALKQFPIQDIYKAAIAMMGNKKYATMPAVSDFVEYLGGGSADDHGQLQGALVWKSVKQYGGTRSVVFDDPTTMAVIQQCFGGWQKMCTELMEDQLQWFLKDFARHYAAYRRSNVRHFGMLPGWADSKNGPALIGDKQKALLVLEQGKATPMIEGLDVSQLATKLGF